MRFVEKDLKQTYNVSSDSICCQHKGAATTLSKLTQSVVKMYMVVSFYICL